MKSQLLTQWVEQNSPTWEAVLDAYCVVDTEGRIVEFNGAFELLSGQPYRKLRCQPKFADVIRWASNIEACPIRRSLDQAENVRTDVRRAQTSRHSDARLTVKSVPVLAPGIVEGSRVIGAFVTLRDDTAEFMLHAKYAVLRREVTIDGLTRLHNRGHMDEVLLKSVKSATRETRPVSVCFIDIDHFKRVNDQYGHQAGDQALMAVAEILRKEARGTDVVGRFGGEEFVVVLTDTDNKGALVFAERVRRRLESLTFSFGGRPIPLRVSLGISCLNEKWEPGANVEKLAKRVLKEADMALYLAKAEGRNRSVDFHAMPKRSRAEETREIVLLDMLQ